MLTFLTRYSSNTSTPSDSKPAGSEYIIDERFPENKLPSTILITSAANPLGTPIIMLASKMNMFEIPILAPGIMSGGNRLSSIKAISAAAASKPVIAIFLVEGLSFFIFYPTTGGIAPLDKGVMRRLCGAQKIIPLLPVIAGVYTQSLEVEQVLSVTRTDLLVVSKQMTL